MFNILNQAEKLSTHLEARGMDWEAEAKGDEVVVGGLRLRDFWVTILDLDTKFLEPAINADLQNDAISLILRFAQENFLVFLLKGGWGKHSEIDNKWTKH